MRSAAIFFSLATFMAANIAAAETDPRKIPAVNRALEKAEAEIQKNRKAYEAANAKAFDEADRTLKQEVDRLSKAGKPEEAVAVKKLTEEYRSDLLNPKPAPPGTVAWKGHRYMVYKERCSWHDAKKKCADAGGQLVIINNADEHAFLITLLGKSGLPVDNLQNRNWDGIWVGATNEMTKGQWVCVDGTALPYADWRPSDPTHPGEHYGAVGLHYGGKWDNRNNEDPCVIGFICEWDD